MINKHKGHLKLTEQELAACLEVLEETSRPYIELKPLQKPTDVLDSKFGGIPYLPPGFEYPYNTCYHSEKKPLKLLCQLNFTQLPQLPGFPKDGILQFYIACEPNEDTYGLDLDNPTNQDGWRIIYHKEIVTDKSLLRNPPELVDGDAMLFPIEGELSLQYELKSMPISHRDSGWKDFMENRLAESAIGQKLKEKYSEVEIEDAIIDVLDVTGHRIGGYPFFTQYDPRSEENSSNAYKYRDYSLLLFQMDSVAGSNIDYEIMWGDAGVANFFITPEALEKLNFSNVLYNWDCF